MAQTTIRKGPAPIRKKQKQLPFPLNIYQSAVGRKWAMAVSGVVLLGFVCRGCDELRRWGCAGTDPPGTDHASESPNRTRRGTGISWYHTMHDVDVVIFA